jgi:2-keto-4-pentenoate hydratase/2-oxohepta-3-ene-1,7-dioic acid hydratase in catechol pathway
MSTSVLRTADAWYVLAPDGAARIDTDAVTTAQLIADRPAVDKALQSEDTVDVGSLELVSPVTTPCRVVAQMVNYKSHATDSGMDPDRVPATFFRKASGSVSPPDVTIVRPEHVRVLDYEVELGLVMGAPLPLGTTVTEADLGRYVAGLVVTNDVSARDIQLPKGQFYESKSYPTFTPVGPRLVLLDPQDVAQIERLRLRLWVNDRIRQDRTVADMIVHPAQALTLLARFQTLDPGDVLLTGTPGGTALKAPKKIMEIIGALLPPERKWASWAAGAVKNPDYLQHGDRVTATIATDDGALDLGTQHNRVEHL